jgi:hypothetical protein
MAHIPPKRGSTHTEETEEGKPITIEGESDSIKIEFPKFYEVNASMSIELSDHGCETSIKAKERPFKSTITRIVLYDVEQYPSGEFKPKNPGKCKIEIFFEHHT